MGTYGERMEWVGVLWKGAWSVGWESELEDDMLQYFVADLSIFTSIQIINLVKLEVEEGAAA